MDDRWFGLGDRGRYPARVNMSEEFVKLQLRTDCDDETYVETPWAIPSGKNQYKLENMPFYAYDLSLHDIVEAVPQDEGFPLVTRVVAKSGNKTLRIIFNGEVGKSKKTETILDDLEEFGCEFECASPTYVVVTIPSNSDFDRITNHLTDNDLKWEYGDPSSKTLFG